MPSYWHRRCSWCTDGRRLDEGSSKFLGRRALSGAKGAKCQGTSVNERLVVLLRTPLTGKGPGYTCGLLARGMVCKTLAVTIVTPRARSFPVSPADVVEVLPKWTRYMPYRWVEAVGRDRLEALFLDVATKAEFRRSSAYIFPDAALETIRRLKRACIPIFREMINCHRGTAKTILDDAYKRLGEAPRHGITEQSVALEQAALESIDYIFCPNPIVEASLLENNLQPSKLLKASYGWDPARFSGSERLLDSHEGLTAVFVGNICVRKGAHLLLDYWAQSGVRGRLVMAGSMEPIIKEKCDERLGRNDVVVLDYVRNVGALYRSADVFVFPTLEEGGPQVTYEACGCGLPVITTPMGAGRIVRDNHEGFVIDPYHRDGWISALRVLAEDVNRRRIMANAALERARHFVWDKVAARRREQILDRLADR
jgi:glycosyltransferase involved in cell wall biosynthesis